MAIIDGRKETLKAEKLACQMTNGRRKRKVGLHGTPASLPGARGQSLLSISRQHELSCASDASSTRGSREVTCYTLLNVVAKEPVQFVGGVFIFRHQSIEPSRSRPRQN